jgi:hypothetical protein
MIQHLLQNVEFYLGPNVTEDPQYATGLCTRKTGLYNDENETPYDNPNDATAFSTSYIP